MSKKEIINGKFTITSPNKEINPLELIDGSIKTGVPIVFTGDRISNFELKKDGEIIDISDLIGIKDATFAGIKLIPGNIIPLILKVDGNDFGFDNLLFRGKKIRDKLKISTEDRNLPYKFEFKIDVNRDNDITLNMNSKADVKQFLKWEELLRALNEKKVVELVSPENDKIVLKLVVKGVTIGNEAGYEFIKKLVNIQENTNHKIILPQNLEISQEDDFNTDLAFKIVNEGIIEVPTEDISFNISAKFIKELIKENKEEKEFMFENPDYILKIFGKEISFGKFRVKLKNYTILHEESTKLMLKDTGENDVMRLSIKPQEKVLMKFQDYPKS